jgi:hypothetical protein
MGEKHMMCLWENETMTNRPIYVIARDIKASWAKVSPYAKPYLDAMASLNSVNDSYYLDTGRDVVLRFMCNAAGFRGDKAKALKAELKAALKA